MSATYKPHRKSSGLHQIAFSIDKASKYIYSKRGFAEGRIITDWKMIVGDMLGKCSNPRKLVFQKDKRSAGTLHVEVYDSGMATQMVYLEPVIIEKIATYFGYKAVGKLKLIQKPMANKMTLDDKSKSKPEPELSTVEQEKLSNLLKGMEEGELKESLKSLGTHVFISNP